MNTASHITRRQALRAMTLTAAAIGSGLSRLEAVSAAPAAAKPTLHVYSDYGWLRGFNSIQSWGARIEDAWWSYDGARMREEMALARSVHANAIRLWIEYTAWYAYPEKVLANFLDAIAAIDENGMKVMPCLFNRWHDRQYDFGGTYVDNITPQGMPMQLEYVRALVTPLAKDPRVFCWDLCNEPQAFGPIDYKRFSEELCQLEFNWLKGVADTVRASGAQQPILIGTVNAKIGMTGSVEFYEPLVDVLCAHPYERTPEGVDKLIESYRALTVNYKKPLLCNEGVPGSEVDEMRGEMHRYYWEKLSTAGFGIMPWSIKEGRSIAARRDRMDGNGVNGKGFHPTFTKDNKLRLGHEWMLGKPKLRAPWEKA